MAGRFVFAAAFDEEQVLTLVLAQTTSARSRLPWHKDQTLPH